MIESLTRAFSSYKVRVATVFVAALFMQIMDGTIVNIALPTLAEEFGVSPTEMDWTVLSFNVGVGVLTANAGWFGERFGRRAVFIAALGGFVGASALCGAAMSLNQLIAARFLQGGAAGMISPIGAALLFDAYPIEERTTASRQVVTVAVVAPAVGPIVGGLILNVTSWRWIFLVNLPFGLLALALAVAWLDSDHRYTKPPRFDFSGFVLLSAGIASFLFGISRGSEAGWTSPIILSSLSAGIAMLIAMFYVESRLESPMLDVKMLRDRMLRNCNILALPLYAGFISLLFLLPLYLQDAAGHTPLSVGVTMVAQPIGVVIMSQVVGRTLYKKIGPRRLLFMGCVIGAAVGAVIALLPMDVSLVVFFGLLLIRGFGMGLIFVPMNSAVYAQIPTDKLPRATAIFTTGRQLAPALGVAIASTVLAAGITGQAKGTAGYQNGWSMAFWSSAILFAIAAVLTSIINDEDAAPTMVLSDAEKQGQAVET